MPIRSWLEEKRQQADQGLTDYLRNTTSDQEILNFYGEGNIIGRKGIPATDNELIKSVSYDNRQKLGLDVRPEVETDTGSFGALGEQNRAIQLLDIPNTANPESGLPWQMQFEKMAFPSGGGTTYAGERFLHDFRVPKGNVSDYGFEVSPNTADVKQQEVRRVLEKPGNYEDKRASYAAQDAGKPLSEYGALDRFAQRDVDEINARDSGIRRFDGEMATPGRWQQEGFEIPENLKRNTLDTFKQQIMRSEAPFGSVSQLTPVREHDSTVKPGGDPDWRANLYEKEGFAGPLTEVSVKTGYGPSSDNVQLFTRGKDRLLPVQPLSEFFTERSGQSSKPSAVGLPPAADFTPFQKAVGTRNYLLGRNILEGRGSLGAGFRGAVGVNAVDLIPSREAIQAFYQGNAGKGVQRMAGDFLLGIPGSVAIGGAMAAAPALAPVAAGVGLGMAALRGGAALDEVSRHQTGESIVPKIRQFLGTQARTRQPAPAGRVAETPRIVPLSPAQRQQMQRQGSQNEAQRRWALAAQRFNPGRGEFGLSEMLFGR